MCGLCLPHCPTFRLTGTESHSPRGRISLARALDQQPALASEASYREALESCLQCRACEKVCPAHVEYGEIIEEARARLRLAQAPTLALRALSWAAEHPRESAIGLGIAGALSRRVPLPGRGARLARRAQAPLQLSVAQQAADVLFVGCVARAFERETHVATLVIAKAMGVSLTALSDQACCGAIHRHLGETARAEAAAQRNRARFAGVGARRVIVSDSGCIDSLKRALEGDPTEVIELCRWLLGLVSMWRPLLSASRPSPQRVGLFMPCTHRNAVGDIEAVRALLSNLPGLELAEIPAGLGCCGAAGPHLVAHPQAADALAAPIVQEILKLGLNAVATTNVGCALHLQERLAAAGATGAAMLRVRHPVSFVVERLMTEHRNLGGAYGAEA